MSHKDMIIDADTKFIIDPATREIKNNSMPETVVQHDHNSERFGFVLPRYIEGHDMMDCNRVEIHYKNIDNSSGEEVSGVYEVSDMRIDEDDETRVAFSWLVSQNATQRVGALIFLVRFSCIAGDGTVEYVWNTSIFKGIFVSSGMYNSDEIIEQYADVLERWKAELVDAANMPLVVNITTDSEGTFVTSDKTYDEIEEAYRDGKNVLAYVEYVDRATTGVDKDILNLIECGNSYAKFSNISKKDETASLATFLSIQTQTVADMEGNVTYNNICSIEKTYIDSAFSTDLTKHTLPIDYYEIGTISETNGKDSAYSARVRTNHYSIEEIKEVILDDTVGCVCYFYDSNLTFLSIKSMQTSTRIDEVTIPDNAEYCRFVFRRKNSEDAIEDIEEFKTHFSVHKYLNDSDITPLKNNYKEVKLDFSFTGHISAAGGTLGSTTMYCSTDYIMVEGKIVLKGFLSQLVAPNYFVNCYDANKKYLGGVLQGNGSSQRYDYTEVVLIPNTKYIRVTNAVDYINKIEMYIVPLYAMDVKTINGRSIVGEGDLDANFKQINSIDFPYNGYIPPSLSLGGELKENSTFLTTDYLEVSPTIMFVATISNMANTVYHINCYNKYKMYLGGVVEGTGSSTKVSVNEVLNLPEGTRFIRITNNKSLANSDNVKVYISPIFNCDNQVDNELLDFSAFRKFGVIGDSLSVGYMSTNSVTSGRNIWYSWGQYLARSIGNTCLNFGFSGATCDSWWTGNTFGKGAFDLDENLCQAYIVGIGTNDPVKNGTLSLGAVTDIDWEDYNNNQATFYGQYARILQHIREKAPYAPVFVFTLPYPRVEEDKNTAIREIVEAINENVTNAEQDNTCGKVYLVDLNSPEYDYCFKGILPKYAFGAHFTAIGYKHCATINNIAISDVMKQNLNDFKFIHTIQYGSNDVID